jgi:phage terminase large subunit-like protein
MVGKSDTEEEESKVSAMTIIEYKTALEQISESVFYEGISRHDANSRLKWCLPNAKLVPHVNDNQYEDKQALYRSWLRRHIKQLN